MNTKNQFLNFSKPLHLCHLPNLAYLVLFICCCFKSYSAEIAVVTLAVGEDFKDIVKIGIENKRNYCQQHGYDFICISESLDINRPIVWSKILAVLNLMKNKEYKWIFWSDADALIMNLATRLEELIDDDFDFIISKDLNGYNAGHFLIKNCEHSHQFFNQVYTHTELINDGFMEQASITKELLNPENSSRTKVIPQRLFNSYAEEFVGHILESTFETGDFIIHFAGIKNKNELKKLFEFYNQKVVNTSDLPTLKQYYRMHGVLDSPKRYQHPEEESEFFINLVIKKKHLKNIMQILLRDGKLAEMFFQHCPELTSFIAFDRNNLYSVPIVEFFNHKYKKQFKYIPCGFEGDNSVGKKILKYSFEYPEKKFDLIYFEGGLSYNFCLTVLKNTKKFAHEESIVWIKNYHLSEVHEAVMNCVNENILEIKTVHEFNESDEKRSFLEAKFT